MRNKLSNVLWGVFFIAVGIGIAGDVINLWNFNVVDLFFDGWWTLFIIVPCLISMIQNGFSTGTTMGFIIGVLLLMSYQVDFNFSIWRLIVPAILIVIGLKLMFQNVFHRKTIHYDNNSGMDGQSGPNFHEQAYTGTGRPEYSAIFSGNRIHVSDTFVGSNLNAVFGGLTLDLRDAVIPHDIEVTATAIFGGIDIYIPRGVKVKTSNVPIFGGVSNKADQFTDPNAPTIYLNATCMFGGIDIK